MAVDLVRKEDGEKLNLSNQIWGFILQTAEENGWEPEGTSLLDVETEEEKMRLAKESLEFIKEIGS